MSAPLVVMFRNVPRMEAVELAAVEKFGKLLRLQPSIVEGRVVFEEVEGRHRNGRTYHVRVSIGLPGEDVVVDHEPADRIGRNTTGAPRRGDRANPTATSAVTMIGRAFDAARRRLNERTRRHRDLKRKNTRH